MRNALGSLIVDPERLTLEQRTQVLRELSGSLLAERDLARVWLGGALRRWLDGEAHDLVALLGLRPPRGCTVTAQFLVQRDKRDAEMLRALVETGSARAAAAKVQPGAPRSPSAFTRARKRRFSSHHR
jgi:hypothetical protein